MHIIGEMTLPEPPQADPPSSEDREDPGNVGDEESSDPESDKSSNGNNGSSNCVEGMLGPLESLTSLAQEGGVRYLNYLLAKADTPHSEVPDVSKIREWSYNDLLRLPKSQQKEWMDACH